MPFYRRLAPSFIIAATMMAAALSGCGDAVPNGRAVSAKTAASTPVASTASRLVPGLAMRPPAASPTQHDLPVTAATALSFEEVNQHPDSQMRMAALEVWAAGAKESLDPVTYALVDADDAVRTRAQELLEQELARR